jgi:hypothetical protein
MFGGHQRSRRAAGTRTMTDVIRGLARGTMASQKRADIEAVKCGETRLVRCYVRPSPTERRRHWKPGTLIVTKNQLRWRGSSRRWETFTLLSGEWSTQLRKALREDRVYKSFGLIVCDRGSESFQLGVPRPDVDLCMAVLNGIITEN